VNLDFDRRLKLEYYGRSRELNDAFLPLRPFSSSFRHTPPVADDGNALGVGPPVAPGKHRRLLSSTLFRKSSGECQL